MQHSATPSPRVRPHQAIPGVQQETLLLQVADQLITERALVSEERAGLIANFDPTVIALKIVVTTPDVNRRWQKIVDPRDLIDAVVIAEFPIQLIFESVFLNERKVFVIAPRHPDIVRIAQLELQQRVDHFHSIIAAATRSLVL